VRFYSTAQAAQSAGFRPCKRCRPEPGAIVAPAAERALALIAAGAADVTGVTAVAQRLHIGERQLRRRVTKAVGTSSLQLARSRRVQTARALLESTELPLTEVAFAAGFRSLRQFNDAIRADLGATPSVIRAGGTIEGPGGWFQIRIRLRQPHDTARLLGFLGARAIPGVETWDRTRYRRALRTGSGSAIVEIEASGEVAQLRARLVAVGDLGEVVGRVRRVLDADADPAVIAARLGPDPLLAASVAAAPGLRLPGAADRFEMLVRAILGQQVSVAAARTLAGRIVERHGPALDEPHGEITRLFPNAAQLHRADLSGLGVTGRRIASVHALSAAVRDGRLDLSAASDGVDEVLRTLPGFGPWTRAYVAMRAFGEPDAFPAGDLALRRACERAGLAGDPRSLEARSQAWRPWRAYAALHLWNASTLEETT